MLFKLWDAQIVRMVLFSWHKKYENGQLWNSVNMLDGGHYVLGYFWHDAQAFRKSPWATWHEKFNIAYIVTHVVWFTNKRLWTRFETEWWILQWMNSPNQTDWTVTELQVHFGCSLTSKSILVWKGLEPINIKASDKVATNYARPNYLRTFVGLLIHFS